MKNPATFVILGALLLGTVACDKDGDETEKARVAPPAPPAAAQATEDAKASALELKLAEDGSATFLIDAPLEKIKGKASKFRGSLTIDPDKLAETRGQVEVDLKTLKTHTFEEDGKNAKQTEHAQNWLELGDDVPEKERNENQWVRFTITSVGSSPASLANAKEVDGRKQIEVTAEGDLWLHGVTVKKSVKLAVSFSGPADAPSELLVRSLEPLRLSLKEHDVKPRDLAGKFLQGALEQVGEKIVDEVQLTLEFRAVPMKK